MMRCFVKQFLVRLKKKLRSFYLDQSCPICSITRTEHSVRHITNGPQSNGVLVDAFTFRRDEHGNLWKVSYNRRCERCGHIWYVPIGWNDWDKSRMSGPKLVSTPGEVKRIGMYIREYGGIPIEVLARITFEERKKAGLLNR